MTFSGTVEVDHHQFVVGSPSAETYEPAVTGSVMEVGPNFVTIMTGVAYGPVSLTVEVLDGQPDDFDNSSEWEMVEEATVKVSKPIRVITLDGDYVPDFPKLPIIRGLNTFRVSARGRDAKWDMTVDEPTEWYLMQIWKATQPAVMRRLHKTDAAWSDEIVTHKTRNWWDPDPAMDASMHIKYGYEQMAIWAKQQAIDWGGRPPTDKLRGVAYAKEFAGHDRMLVDAMARARAPKLRKIAAWAARRAYTIADIADIEWIRDGLAALDNGTPLPPPFERPAEYERVWDAFNADSRIKLWTTTDSGDRIPVVAAQHAVNALIEASREKPLAAAIGALRTAALTGGSDYVQLIADVRREFFPKLAPADHYERWIGYTVDDVPSG
ncbi:transposase [Williamsia muralis]|uniref:Transposase n=1 Tax=Williamsia marianensis TaxID=85044 RepID=A0A2G3PM53_WILMA|nr:transposase [Williamsia marianensis]